MGNRDKKNVKKWEENAEGKMKGYKTVEEIYEAMKRGMGEISEINETERDEGGEERHKRYERDVRESKRKKEG